MYYYNQSWEDFEKYGSCRDVDTDYLQETSRLLYENRYKLKNTALELKNSLPKSTFVFSEIIGDGEDLTDYLKEFIDNGVISENRAYEIKKQLSDEYHADLLTDDGLATRFNFLINYDVFKDFILPIDDFLFDGAVCPSCGHTYMLSDNFCSICGFNLQANHDGGLNKKQYELINLFRGDSEVYGKLQEPYFSNDEKFSKDILMKLVSGSDKLDGYFDMLDDDYSQNERKILSLIFKVFGSDESSLKRLIYHPIDSNEFEEIFMSKLFEHPEYFEEFIELMEDEFENSDSLIDYKLDDIVYGKDYHLDFNHEIFQVLEFIQKGGSYEIAFNLIIQDSRWTLDTFRELLSNQNLVYVDWKNYGHNYRVKDLKTFLKDNDLKVSGTKQVLIDRLDENKVIAGPNFYRLTEGGRYFLKEYSWIDFFDEFLYDFDFNDFSKFKDENPDMDLIMLSNNFLDKHFKLAKKYKDKSYILASKNAKENISHDGEDYLEYLNTKFD